MTKATHTVLSPLKCGGKRYAPGKPFDAAEHGLTADAVAALEANKVLGPPALEAAPATAETAAPTDAEERRAAIIEAVRSLDRETEFSKTGLPKVAPLDKALGWKVDVTEMTSIAKTGEDWAALLDGDQSKAGTADNDQSETGAGGAT